MHVMYAYRVCCACDVCIQIVVRVFYVHRECIARVICAKRTYSASHIVGVREPVVHEGVLRV